MPGIFGLIDPAGPDPDALVAAAAREAWRGRPVVAVDGAVALGSYDNAGVFETPDSITVADARVDAVDGAAAVGTSAARLDAAFRHDPAAGLGRVAGDFAVANYDRPSQTLRISRDPAAMRSLHWARSGARVGFASDASVLVALGLAPGTLDGEAVASFLAYRNTERTASGLAGVRRVAGGLTLCFPATGEATSHRWYEPERVAERDAAPDEFAAELRAALVEAVLSRSRGRRTAVLLSGGRDSAAVADALAVAGITATCVTVCYPPELGVAECGRARTLAHALGHEWLGIDAPGEVDERALLEVASRKSSPVDVTLHQHALLLDRVVAESGAEVIMDGRGGEPLFVAPPVAVGELVRSGNPSLAVRAARMYNTEWTYPYRVQAKAALRGLAPRRLLHVRERLRRTPDWVVGAKSERIDAHTAPRNAREHLVTALDDIAAGNSAELFSDIEHAGAQHVSPILDRRVSAIALALPLELRVPVPVPKPMLSRALPGIDDLTRTKADFAQVYVSWADAIRRALPDWFGPGSRVARLGLVDASRPPPYGVGRWYGQTFAWAALEAWLRTHHD